MFSCFCINPISGLIKFCYLIIIISVLELKSMYILMIIICTVPPIIVLISEACPGQSTSVH